MNRFIEILNEKLIKNKQLGRISLAAVLEDIKQAESEYKGGWIPCSERLPEQTEKVLVITDKGCYYIARLNTQNEWVCYAEMINTKITYSRVIAWQPLPEVYKEGDIKNE